MFRASLRSAEQEDLVAIERLLTESNLPTAGVAEALHSFVVAESAEDSGRIVGVVGMELCGGNYGLLRSTAVTPEWRGSGLGRQLVERAIADAELRGVKALYLLTTTAERYFPSFGFATTTREGVPEAVKQSVEFCSACPASATVMVLDLAKTMNDE
jgi:amino-acid N-acetyltransferase